MKALAAAALGRIDSLAVRDIPQPEPGPGQVRVRMACSAVNPADFKVLEGQFVGRLLHGRPTPMVPGYDVAGVVDALGAGVTDLRVGDRVFGHQQYASSTVHGAFAEATVLHADALAVLPDNVDFASAAAAATAGTTTLQALRDKGRLRAGQRVLVIGAAGGLGTLGVAIAARLGAEVTAVCSAATAELVRSLGATTVLDRAAAPYASGGPYDVIFDTPAAVTYGEVKGVMAAEGALVTTLPGPALALGRLATALSRRRVAFVAVRAVRADLACIAGWLADGMPVAIDTRFPVREGAAAIEAAKRGGRTGRLVVDIEGGW